MLFARTKQSLLNLQRERTLTLGEMYAVMQDIMQDIQDETGTNPADLEADDTALQKWRTVAHVLLQTAVTDSASQMTDRQRARMEALQNELEARHAETADAEAALAEGEQQIAALNKELDALEDLVRQKEEQTAGLTALRKKEEALHRALDNLSVVDPEQLAAQIEALEQEKQTREAAVRRTESLQQELHALQDEAADQQAEAEQLLHEKQEVLSRIAAQKQEKAEREAELAAVQEEAGSVSEAIAAAEQTLQEHTDACAALKQKLSEVSGAAHARQEQMEALQAEYDMLTGENGGIEAALAQKHQLIDDAKAKQDQLKQYLSEAASELESADAETEQLMKEKQETEQKRQSLKETLDTVKTELDTAAAELSEMNAQTEEFSASLDEMRQKKQDAQAAHDAAKQEYDETAAACQALRDELAVMKAETENKQSKIAESEAEKKLLSEMAAELLSSADTFGKETSALRLKIKVLTEQKQAALDRKTEQEQILAQKQEEFDRIAASSRETDEQITVLESDIAEKEQSLEQVEERIRQLGARQQDLIREVNEKQAMLSHSDIVGLQEKLESLKTELKTVQEQRAVMQTEHETLSGTLQDEQIAARKASLELEGLEKQVAEIQTQRNEMTARRREMENQLDLCRKDIEEYRRAFSPDQYEAQKREIQSCQEMIRFYEEGVQSLFGINIPAEFFAQNGMPLLEKQQQTLDDELKAVRALMEGLHKDYILVIEDTERKVNQYAV